MENPTMARFSRLAIHPVVLLDDRKDIAEQFPAERFDGSERGGVARDIAVGHDDQHRHGLMLRQQVLLDLGSVAETDPAFLGIAAAVQKIKNREPAVAGYRS
jgi:hypothetical protein